MTETVDESGQNNTDATDASNQAASDDVNQQQAADEGVKTPDTDANDGGDDAAGGEQDDDAESQAPESYEFNLPEGIPEGIEVDTQLAEAMSPLLKKHNLSQEAVNELVEVYAKHEATKMQGYTSTLTERDSEWTEQVKKDPEIGGDKLDESLGLMNKAIMSLGGQELANDIIESGLGNNPRLIKAFYKVGKLIGEDSGDRGDAPEEDVAPEQKWYKT